MDWLNVTLLLSMILVVLILAWGLITMARGGEYNKSNSNILMRYRIILQAIAILIFICALIYKRYYNG